MCGGDGGGELLSVCQEGTEEENWTIGLGSHCLLVILRCVRCRVDISWLMPRHILTICSFERLRPTVAGNLASSPKGRDFETLKQLPKTHRELPVAYHPFEDNPPREDGLSQYRKRAERDGGEG